ncbi:MAG: DUF6285 domain-containing protein [Gammaproteobacteria bacterium]
MAHDGPVLPEMLATVREFVAGITPQLDGLDRYHALCAQFLLDCALRELTQWEACETPDDRRLRALAGAAPAQPMEEVVTTLCQRIRAGYFDDDLESLCETLTAHVVDKVRVAKPAVLAPQHRDSTAGRKERADERQQD